MPNRRIAVYGARGDTPPWRTYLQGLDRGATGYGRSRPRDAAVAHREVAPTFFVLCEADDRPIAGVRTHLFGEGARLPILDDLSDVVHPGRLKDTIKQRRGKGVIYTTGLWVDPDWKKSGVLGHLLRAHYVLVAMAGARWSVATAHNDYLELWHEVGYREDPQVPAFPWPDPLSPGWVLWSDTSALDAACPGLWTWAKAEAAQTKMRGKGVLREIEPFEG